MLSENSNETMQRGKKRKKKSFLQKQKKFAKNGSFGRGTQLSPDMYEYFINIMKVMNSKKDDEEEMSVLSSNVLQELQEKESEYCCNQIVSRIVENLLPHSSDDEFSVFIDKFSENLRPIFCDPFGSHVLQSSLVTAYQKYQKLNQSDEKISLKYYNYILKISNFLFNNLDDFIWDIYSNAVARTVFNVLSGIPVKGEVKIDTERSAPENVPEEFDSLLKKYVKKVVAWPQLSDICNQPANSGFLQSLLLASKKLDECSEIIERIIAFYENSPLDISDEDNIPFTRLLEVVLTVANKAYLKRIYKLVFKEKLTELAASKFGNFAVQKLILNCTSKKIFGKIFAKLSPCMEDIIKKQYSGVLLAVVKKCRTLEILQADCMSMVLNIFKTNNPGLSILSVLCLTSVESFNEESLPITLHGTLIIEELLNYKKPITIVNGILELSQSQLVTVLSDVRGSHVTDAFVKSSTIGEKSRTRLFKKLQGAYLLLATSKHGSRSIDAIWSVISIQQKVHVAEELMGKQSELSGSVYGNGFARKINLGSFRRSKDDWIQAQKSAASAKIHFADILQKK